MTNHQAQRTARRKLQAAARSFDRSRIASAASPLPPAIFMTDRPARTPDILGVASRLPHGWAIVYRHFGDTDRVETARKLMTVASRRGLILLIAADPALAQHVHAQGVHWPARLLTTRPLRHRFAIETASAHTAAELARAARAGVDAAIFSAVFPSQSPSATAPIGVPRFINIARNAPLPLYALGGVSSENAARLAGGRANTTAGFAAVSSIHDAWKNSPES